MEIKPSISIHIDKSNFMYSILLLDEYPHVDYILEKSKHRVTNASSWYIQEFFEKWENHAKSLNVEFIDNLNLIISKRKLSMINATLMMVASMKGIKYKVDKWGDIENPYVTFPNNKFILPLEEILINWKKIEKSANQMLNIVGKICNKYQNDYDDSRIIEFIENDSKDSLYNLMDMFCGTCDYYYDKWSYFRYKYMLEIWKLILHHKKEM